MEEYRDLTLNVGTPAWMAPELFKNRQYTEKCDVYSFGIGMSSSPIQLLLTSFSVVGDSNKERTICWNYGLVTPSHGSKRNPS